MIDPGFTQEDLLDELLSEGLLGVIEEYDPKTMVTAPVMAERLGVSWHTANRRLTELLKAGKLELVMVRTGQGQPQKAYKRKRGP